MEVVYLDIETTELIKKGIPNRDMTIAIAGTLWRGIFNTYNEDEVDDLIKYLNMADLIVGHNIFWFDYGVLSGYFQYPEVVLGAKGKGIKGKTFDTQMKFAILAGDGIQAGHIMALDNLCSSFSMVKSCDSKLIPQMWKDGKYEEVKSYLLNDLLMTEKLYLAGCCGTKIKYDHKVYGKSQGEREIYLKW